MLNVAGTGGRGEGRRRCEERAPAAPADLRPRRRRRHPPEPRQPPRRHRRPRVEARRHRAHRAPAPPRREIPATRERLHAPTARTASRTHRRGRARARRRRRHGINTARLSTSSRVAKPPRPDDGASDWPLRTEPRRVARARDSRACDRSKRPGRTRRTSAGVSPPFPVSARRRKLPATLRCPSLPPKREQRDGPNRRQLSGANRSITLPSGSCTRRVAPTLERVPRLLVARSAGVCELSVALVDIFRRFAAERVRHPVSA